MNRGNQRKAIMSHKNRAVFVEPLQEVKFEIEQVPFTLASKKNVRSKRVGRRHDLLDKLMCAIDISQIVKDCGVALFWGALIGFGILFAFISYQVGLNRIYIAK